MSKISGSLIEQVKQVSFDETLGDVGRQVSNELQEILPESAKDFIRKHKLLTKGVVIAVSALVSTKTQEDWSIKRRTRRIFTDAVDNL